MPIVKNELRCECGNGDFQTTFTWDGESVTEFTPLQCVNCGAPPPHCKPA